MKATFTELKNMAVNGCENEYLNTDGIVGGVKQGVAAGTGIIAGCAVWKETKFSDAGLIAATGVGVGTYRATSIGIDLVGNLAKNLALKAKLNGITPSSAFEAVKSKIPHKESSETVAAESVATEPASTFDPNVAEDATFIVSEPADPETDADGEI